MRTAVYDASERPITFDILYWIATVGAMAGGPVQFVILADRFRQKTTKDKALTDAQKLGRVHHILAQSCRLLPGSQHVVVTDGNQAARWRASDALMPETFVRACIEQWKAGRDIFRFRAPVDALDAIGNRFDGAVVITVRSNSAVPEKNSRLASWLAAAGYLKSLGKRVIMIPDTESVVRNTPLPSSVDWYPAAAMDIGLRAAAYQRAELSLSMGIGPVAANIFMPGSRYVMFLHHRALASSSQIRSFEKIWGLPWGKQLPFATDGQVLDFRADDEGAVIDAIDRVIQ